MGKAHTTVSFTGSKPYPVRSPRKLWYYRSYGSNRRSVMMIFFLILIAIASISILNHHSWKSHTTLSNMPDWVLIRAADALEELKIRKPRVTWPFRPWRGHGAVEWVTTDYSSNATSYPQSKKIASDALCQAWLENTQNYYTHIDVNERSRWMTIEQRHYCMDKYQITPRIDGRVPIEKNEYHPIPRLMTEARQKWSQLVNKQSRSLKEAYIEYTRRYGRNPPAGFDKWYKFAKEKNFLMIDEFDLMDHNLAIFRAFTPEALQARVNYLSENLHIGWGIRVRDGRVTTEGPLRDHDRAKGIVDLMTRFAHNLPDMFMWYNGHDNAQIALSYEERQRLTLKGVNQDFDNQVEAPFEPEELGPSSHYGMPSFCPPDSVARQPGFTWGDAPKDSTGYEIPPLINGTVGSVIADLKSYINLCDSVDFRHYHVTTSWVYMQRPTPVLPLFSAGVQVTHGDIRAIYVEQFNRTDHINPPWSLRTSDVAVWRGQTSGPQWDTIMPWRTSQRARIHLQSHQRMGNRTVVFADTENLRDSDRVFTQTIPNNVLNPSFLDAGMVGPAVQCIKEDGTCDEMDYVFNHYDDYMPTEEQALHKYVLDIDGNSWSGRFRRLMLSNAAVLKATIYPEFWLDWSVPWLHYIPIQVDYSDLWDVLAFFRGGINGENNHDYLARQIAHAGKDFATKCLRWEDIEVVQYRLMIEYARLYAGTGDYVYSV